MIESESEPETPLMDVEEPDTGTSGQHNCKKEHVRPRQTQANQGPGQSKFPNKFSKCAYIGDSMGPLTITTGHMTDTEVDRAIKDAKIETDIRNEEEKTVRISKKLKSV